MPKYYLVHVWGCVEPSVQNPQDPVEDWDEFLLYARKFVQEVAPKRGEDIIFWLQEDEENEVTAGSFTEEQLYPRCPECNSSLVIDDTSLLCRRCGWTAEAN